MTPQLPALTQQQVETAVNRGLDVCQKLMHLWSLIKPAVSRWHADRKRTTQSDALNTVARLEQEDRDDFRRQGFSDAQIEKIFAEARRRQIADAFIPAGSDTD